MFKRICQVQWIALFRLVRLSNSLPASALVLVGAHLATPRPAPYQLPPARVWLAACAMWLVTAYGYASNDLHDIVEDRINKPDRPLASGAFSVRRGRQLVGVLALGALTCAALLGLAPLLAAGSVLLLLQLYNRRLKATAGAGNLLIALLAGAILPVGAVAAYGYDAHALLRVVTPSALLSSFVVAREMIKTLEDGSGDSQAGKMTVAVRLGEAATLRLVAVAAGGVVLFSLLAWRCLAYSSTFLAVTTLGVSIPLFFTFFYLRWQTTSLRTSRCLALLKGSYFAGLLALIVA